jgi:hypothetical protein
LEKEAKTFDCCGGGLGGRAHRAIYGGGIRGTFMFRAIAIALVFALPAAAATPPALTSTVNQFVTSCSATDLNAFAAVFTVSPNITDDIAPYNWQGKDTPAHYMAALKATIKSAGWDNFALAPSAAPYVEVTGAYAYATVPLFVNYNFKGKPRQDAGIFTLALKQVGKGWKISSASWTYTKQSS